MESNQVDSLQQMVTGINGILGGYGKSEHVKVVRLFNVNSIVEIR
jgi:hypothetical protein